MDHGLHGKTKVTWTLDSCVVESIEELMNISLNTTVHIEHALGRLSSRPATRTLASLLNSSVVAQAAFDDRGA